MNKHGGVTPMYKRPLRSDEIYHAWFGKGGQRDNHKYIARIDLGGKFRYFYDQAQLAAYKAAAAGRQVANRAGQVAGQVADGARATGGQLAKNARTVGEQAASTAKKTVENAKKNISDTIDTKVTGEYYKDKMSTAKSNQTRWNKLANDVSDRRYPRKVANDYGREYEKAKAGYNKSVAGRVGNAVRKAKDVVDSKITGQKYIDRATTAQTQADRESSSAKYEYENANYLKKRYGTSGPNSSKLYENGMKEGDRHAKRADSARKGAKSAMNDYYTKSAKGRVEKAALEARDAVDDVQERAKNMTKNAQKKITDTVDNVRDAADEVGRRAKRAQNFISRTLSKHSSKKK